MTKCTARAFIAVRPADQQAANDACLAAVGEEGRNTFVAQWPPQDEAGTVAAEYYLCDWQMLPDQRTALEAEFTRRGIAARFYDCDDWDPVRRTVTYRTVDEDLKRERTLTVRQR